MADSLAGTQKFEIPIDEVSLPHACSRSDREGDSDGAFIHLHVRHTHAVEFSHRPTKPKWLSDGDGDGACIQTLTSTAGAFSSKLPTRLLRTEGIMVPAVYKRFPHEGGIPS